MTRNVLLAALVTLVLAPQTGLCEDPAAGKASKPDAPLAEMITPAAERSLDKGLTWLAGRQYEDGSFASGLYRGNVGISGLCGLAFLSSGSTPGRGPYGENINKTIDYLLSCMQQGGYINAPAGAGHGPMYGHGFATLFLAECCGMSSRGDLREKLAKAVKLIVNTQNEEGGWRYYPQRLDADISATVCQVMALRAARNAGFYVPNETIDRSIHYVKRSQNADGGFMYMLHGGESAFPRSAAAVVALYSAGIYEGPESEKGLDYLRQCRAQDATTQRDDYFEYGQYYAAQAMWHSGGDVWKDAFPAMRDELVGRQRDDGSWMSTFGPEYATAMCLLVLQVPNDALPIFQR